MADRDDFGESLEGNIKLEQYSTSQNEEAKDNHGFQPEESTNASQHDADGSQGLGGLSTLDEPVGETIVSELSFFVSDCILLSIEKGFSSNLAEIACRD